MKCPYCHKELNCQLDEEKIAEIINTCLVMDKLQIDEPALIFPERIEFKRLGSWKEIVKYLAHTIAQAGKDLIK